MDQVETFDFKFSSIVNFLKYNEVLLPQAKIAVKSGHVSSCQFNCETKILYGTVKESTGHAYYNVEINLSDKFIIESATCDCSQSTICHHIAALALQSACKIQSHSLEIKKDPGFDSSNHDHFTEPVQSLEEIFVKEEYELQPTTTIKMERDELGENEHSLTSIYKEEIPTNFHCSEIWHLSEVKTEESSVEGTSWYIDDTNQDQQLLDVKDVKLLDEASIRHTNRLMRQRQHYQKLKEQETPEETAKRKAERAKRERDRYYKRKMQKTAEELAERNKRERERYQIRMANMTPEQILQRNKREQARHRRRMLLATPEQLAERARRERERYQKRMSVASPEKLAQRAKRERERYQRRMAMATPEELAERSKRIRERYLKRKLSQEQQGHEMKPSFMCETCGKQFSRSTNLKMHSYRHTNAYTIACRLCPKRFQTRTSLRKHEVRSHPMIRQHLCLICGVRRTSKTELRNHMNTHSVENNSSRMYECHVCSNNFIQLSDLGVHYKSSHNM